MTPALFILCDLLLFAVLVIYVASASDHIIFTCSLRFPFWRNARFTEIRPLLLFVTRSPGHPPIFCQRCIEFSRQRSIEFSYQRCIELIHPARTAAGRPLVTSGAAALILSAFRRVRRSTSTDALQTGDAGRAGVQLSSEAVHRT
jgi:hypothetical protein